MKFRKSAGFCLILTAVLTICAIPQNANANLLLNPGFESGDSMPNSWSTYGSGSYIYRKDYSRTG